MGIPALGYPDPSTGNTTGAFTFALPQGLSTQITTFFDFKRYEVLRVRQYTLNPFVMEPLCEHGNLELECLDLRACQVPELHTFALTSRQDDSKPRDTTVDFGNQILENLNSTRHLIEVNEIEAGRAGAVSCIQSAMAPTHV